MNRVTRRGFLAAAGTVTLAGCVDAGDRASDVPDQTTPSTAIPDTETATTTPAEQALPPERERVLPLPLSPDELRDATEHGGPGKNGIPSIDTPKPSQFDEPSRADSYLAPDDVVFGVARDGVAKAYPQKILVWHEICNDVIAGDRVSVTYCPLTGTAVGFERGPITFGVSGRLLNDNLVMYDRATEAWWPQMLATSIPGQWNSSPGTRSLRECRVIWTTWERWKTRHPDTLVLNRDTGFIRNYSADPYGSYNPKKGYYAHGETLRPPLFEDDRVHPKRVVIGVRTPAGAATFLKDALREQGLMRGSIGATPILAVYDPVLDTASVYRNPDGREFQYGREGTVTADGTSYPSDALPLERVVAMDAMWFAWYGFYPDTAVYE